MRNKLRNVATSWLENDSLLRSVLRTSLDNSDDIDIVEIRSSGPRRKIICEVDSTRYICLLNLDRTYSAGLANMHRAARANGVPVANVVAEGNGFWYGLPYGYLLLSWCEGIPCYKRNFILDHKQLYAIGNAIGKLHSVHKSEIGPISHGRQQQYETRAELVNKLRGLKKQFFDTRKDTPSRTYEALDSFLHTGVSSLNERDFEYLNHGDLHCANILMGRNGPQFIDSDQMRIVFPLGELVRALMESYTGLDRDMQNSLLSGYLESVCDRIRNVWEEHFAFTVAGAFLVIAKIYSRRGSRTGIEAKSKERNRITVEALKLCSLSIANNPHHYKYWDQVIEEFHCERQQLGFKPRRMTKLSSATDLLEEKDHDEGIVK